MLPGQLPNYELCYVCGHANPLGLNVRFQVRGSSVITRFQPSQHHCGYPGRLHGGVMATLLDETMGWAPCLAAGRFCLAVELNVRYLKSPAPGQELTIVGTAGDVTGRIWEATGEIRDAEGTVYARGKGRYFPLSEAETAGVMQLLTLEGETLTLAEAIARAMQAG